MNNTLKDIEQLVAEVAQAAISGNIPLQEKLDALKLLTPYYAVLKKAKGKSDDESSDGTTMGDMRERLRVVEEPDDGGVETGSRRARSRT
jgi:hypothetical protein